MDKHSLPIFVEFENTSGNSIAVDIRTIRGFVQQIPNARGITTYGSPTYSEECTCLEITGGRLWVKETYGIVHERITDAIASYYEQETNRCLARSL